MIKFEYNDGGRSQYYKGVAGDCVTRAIAIATGKDYKKVYNDMASGMKKLTGTKSARNGIPKKLYHEYLLKNGFKWVATTGIGTGCRVHLKTSELPKGILIVRVSRHLACVVNGVLNDIYDCSRNGTRCVYGYYLKE